MTVKELRDVLDSAMLQWGQDVVIVVYDNGDYAIEDAWFDRARGVFAIQLMDDGK